VTLYEKTGELGGQFILATKPPHKEELQNILDYLRVQMDKLGVRIELGREVTAKLVEEHKPDAVIVATGAVPLVPNIPSIEDKRVVTAWDVLAGAASVKDEAVVIGGGEVGCETAEYLSELGKNATLVEMLRGLALDMELFNRHLLLQRLKEKKITTLMETTFEGVAEEGIAVSDAHGKRTLKAESIVLAIGSKPNNELAKALKGKVENLYVVGDCVEPRKSLEAIHEGSWAARQI